MGGNDMKNTQLGIVPFGVGRFSGCFFFYHDQHGSTNIKLATVCVYTFCLFVIYSRTAGCLGFLPAFGLVLFQLGRSVPKP